MGPLALPERGPIYLDANALIYSLEMVAPYFPLLARYDMKRNDAVFR